MDFSEHLNECEMEELLGLKENISILQTLLIFHKVLLIRRDYFGNSQSLRTNIKEKEDKIKHYQKEIRKLLLTKPITELAHQKWEDDGRPEGKSLDFWLEAEQEINSLYDLANLMGDN